MRERYPLHQSPFFRLRRKSTLAKILGVNLRELRHLTSTETLYREWEEPKKKGGTRHIENPHKTLKLVQSRIAKLLARIEPPDFLYCPVKGKSYVDNAARHSGARVVKCIDIRNYFPSTTELRVHRFFSQRLECAPDVAFLLTKISTYRGHLPTGSPLSPILAFFAHYDIWTEINEIAAASGATLTVYIDDVTVSGAQVSDKLVWEIKQIIHASGLRYHKEKKFIDRAAEITGVIVDGGKTKLPKRGLKKIHDARQLLSSARKANDVEAQQALEARLSGLLGQARQLDKKIAISR